MNFSRIPASPTPSPPRERRARRPVLPLALALLAAGAQAHGPQADDPDPPPGLRLSAAAAVSLLDASARLPSAPLTGYLLQGDAGIDRRGLGLEHGVAALDWRADDTWAASLALGQHGSDRPHAEAAVLQARGRVGGGQWQLSAGRHKPALGPVLNGAGHLDRFALVPLAKQATLGGDGVDDGLQLGWQPPAGPFGQVALDAGLWRGVVFPGSAGAAPAPTLHAALARGAWRLDVFTARFRPVGRGALIQTLGHSHAAPSCTAVSTQVLCFAGRTRVSGASLRWAGADGLPLSATAAGWWRQDTGLLTSANGQADYRGSTRGGWLEAVWHGPAQTELGWRLERLNARHGLNGPGAAWLADEAGFGRYQPARRQALVLGLRPDARTDWRLEAGHEQVAATRARYVLLRLVWRFDQVWPAADTWG